MRFTKFFGRWSPSDPAKLLKELPYGRRTEPVLDWLDPQTAPGTRRKATVKDLSVGDQDRLTEAADRLEALAKAKGGISFEMDLVGRHLTGIGLAHPTENGFLFHPTLAVPYLRGTALKQVARDCAEEEVAIDELPDAERVEAQLRIDRIFGAVDAKGTPKSSGSIAFLDALPIAPVTLTAEQITPHYGRYYSENPATTLERDDMQRPADWHEPVPVTLLAVEASFAKPLGFRIAILPVGRPGGTVDDDLKAVRGWLAEGLAWNGIGAKTMLGYGRLEPAPDRWKVGDEAILSLAGGIRVKIAEIGDAHFVVRNVRTDKPLKVTDLSLLSRP